jgi:uncharacterized protein YggU (UPF0235/DUF167 family)
MTTLEVRVVPRARRRGVEIGDRGVVVRVLVAPVDQRATEEARVVLAHALSAPVSAVVLRRGHRSRVKVFEVQGMTKAQALQRIRRSNG